MKTVYKDCLIDVFRDSGLISFSVLDNINGCEIVSGYSEGEDNVWSWIKDMKATVDEYRMNGMEQL